MAKLTEMAFLDGRTYEGLMGVWSQYVGRIFLDWMAPPSGLDWADIGCGNGVFSEMIAVGCRPASIKGIDPSEAQLTYARARLPDPKTTFEKGSAMALPYADKSIDVAVMALVIFFVPDPVKGVAEMVRVVKPGGMVAAYAWDNTRGGFPLEAIWDEMNKMGVPPVRPPSEAASRMETMRELWINAGLAEIETKEIVVERSFADFEDYWDKNLSMNAGVQIADMSPEDQAELKNRVRARLPCDLSGRITYSARANAIKGRLPY